jgi:hypothetical protein
MKPVVYFEYLTGLWRLVMVELNTGLVGSSMQGANRSKTVSGTLDLVPNKFHIEETSKAEIREMGASRNPSKLEGTGTKQINTEASVNTVVPPEIGKGTLIDSIV